MSKGFLYILKNTKGKFYVGSTDNLERRIYQHQVGHTQTTRNMKDSVLVLTQEYESLETARKIERKIKILGLISDIIAEIRQGSGFFVVSTHGIKKHSHNCAR